MLGASQSLPDVLPYVLAFAAGNFLYIAMADLIPDLHRGGIEGGPFRQLAAHRRRNPDDRHALGRPTICLCKNRRQSVLNFREKSDPAIFAEIAGTLFAPGRSSDPTAPATDRAMRGRRLVR